MKKWDPDKSGTVRIDLKNSPELRELAQSAEPPMVPVAKNNSIVYSQESWSETSAASKLFFELFEGVYDGILIMGFDGAVLHTNERARDLFLHDEDDFATVTIQDVFSGFDIGTLNWVCQKLQNRRRVFIECYCDRKDETSFPADVTVSILHFFNTPKLCFMVRNVSVRKQTELALKQAQEDLINVAHKAGMADIATGVLHDVGNLLNSINVSSELIGGVVRNSAIDGMVKINKLLQDHPDDLGEFLTLDPTGKRLPEAYDYLEKTLSEERNKVIAETERLQHRLGLLRQVISTQQDYARLGLFYQEVNLLEVIDDALALQQTHLSNHAVRIEKDCDESLVFTTQKTKLIYILVNLITNAVDALKASNTPEAERLITISAEATEDEVHLNVSDNGVGIPAESHTKIFAHGFTTKVTGHGFGLHTCANFMKEIGGSITVHSDGDGLGSCFHLVFPRQAASKKSV